eukprot:g1764.t1
MVLGDMVPQQSQKGAMFAPFHTTATHISKRDGLVTSASLMVNGKSARSAVKLAKSANLSMVLHLNITEGSPISPAGKVKSLIQHESKYFLGKQGFWDAARQNKIQKDDVITETVAQIEKFKELVGVYPTHVDGHQHAHIANGLPQILAPIFHKYDIKSTRIPREVVVSSTAKSFYKEVVRHAEIALPIYNLNNILTTTFFIGLRIMGAKMTCENIIQATRETCLREQALISNSTTTTKTTDNSNCNYSTLEIMCHPGISFNDPQEVKNGGCGSGLKGDKYDYGVDDFCTSKDREIELNTLISPNLSDFLVNENFRLCTWENAFNAAGNPNGGENNHGNYSINRNKAAINGIINILSDMTPMTGNATTALRWRRILSTRYKVRIIDTRQESDRAKYMLKAYHNVNSHNKKEKTGNREFSIVLALNATKSIPFLSNYDHEYIVIAGGTDINHNLGKCINILKQAKYIVTFTNVMQNKIKETINTRPENIITIPQSVDVLSLNLNSNINSYGKRWFRKQYDDNYVNSNTNKSNNDLLILLPAGIRPVKDPGYLIDVVNNQAKFHSNYNSNTTNKNTRKIKLILIGPVRDEKLFTNLKSKESKYFKIHPPVQLKEMLVAMKEADVVVNTSLSEGMSGAILEAMAIGTPVMARNIPANKALLFEKNVGILFSSPEDFINKLHDSFIKKDKEKDIHELIERAKEFVKDHSMEKEGIAYFKILQKLLDSHKGEEEEEPLLKKHKKSTTQIL